MTKIKTFRKLVNKVFPWLCYAFIAFGLWARFSMLHMSYEYDELFTAVSSDPSRPLGWLYHTYLLPDVHPPLYNIFLWCYNHFVPFGPELWLRLPGVWLSFFAVAAAWFDFPKRFGKKARLAFVSMLSCGAFIAFYAQYARSYSWILFLSVLFTFSFLDVSRAVYKGRPVTRKRWIKFALLAVLLCWSHYFGALLFGVFSILLFAQAWYYKRKLWPFIWIPCLIFILFLPWLLPNLWINISYNRFGGNWWANNKSFRNVLPELVFFFFSSFASHLAVCLVVFTGLFFLYKKYKRTGAFAYLREVALLAAACLLGVGLVGLLSLKIHLMISRYFTVFIPSAFLCCSLLAAPALRKSGLVCLLFCVMLGMNVRSTLRLQRVVTQTFFLPARATLLTYRDWYPDKELFVVALEAFPPASMAPMYGFYPNRVWNMNMPVTELYQLDEAEREKLLARRDQALIWMPNCADEKLNRLSAEWNRSVLIDRMIGSSCFLKLSDKGVQFPQQETPSSGRSSDAGETLL